MKRVGMVVWNTFETDARVLKEAQTLTAAGYEVTVCALHTPGVTERREVMAGGVRVRRVLRSPVMLIPAKRRQEARLNAARREAAANGPGGGGPAKRLGRFRQFLSVLFRLYTHTLLLFALLGTRPHVVHAHDANTLVVGWLAARLSRARLVYDAHEISTDREGYRHIRRWIGLIEKRLMPKADACITTTETRARFFARAYGVPRPRVLQNRPRYVALDKTERLRRELDLGPDWPIFVYQGGLQPGRGLEDLVTAAAEVPAAYFVFIGGGRLEGELKGRAAELDVEDRVRFVPTVALDQLLDYTASADIGVQPIRNTCLNHFSTDSNKLFEYVMAGLPVVASDFPEIRAVVRGHELGLVFDPEKPGALVAALQEMLADPARQARWRANARRARESLSWEAQEDVLLSIYREMT
ncbi:glycosyltransferase family 4 protein [Gammaproteobacteria bacterium AB-CW1]|uniref:Glycosyltransferase family 4 protein n=1 Tax=Natronospira elongata TaxID=3110268 RepID=A0AAP6MKU3_9GAMM|nr:glycosyltransferase family 4 protein [Gammaproteobacteria bacterium AB-CW1]